MWELGRAYGHLEHEELLEELRGQPLTPPRARTWEEQVADRRAELDHYAQLQREAAASPP